VDLVLSGYSHESALPCALPEIVAHIRRKPLAAAPHCAIHLGDDVTAVPLNRGFILSVRDLVLHANSLEVLSRLGQRRALQEFTGKGDESALQQLNHYQLLSFGEKAGRLEVAEIPAQYTARYVDGDFVTFSFVPLTVEINITDICNFSCVHCMQDSGPHGRPSAATALSTERILDLIGECGRLHVPNLLLMGGEPLVHPDFFTFVEYARGAGIPHIRTSTNGWLIDDAVAERLSRYFRRIQVSLHGARPSTHDGIVQKPGAWERAKQAVRLLQGNGVQVTISFSVLRDNAQEIVEMARVMKEWGVESLRFLRLVSKGRGCLLEAWRQEEISEMGNRLRGICEEVGSDLEIDAGGFPPLQPTRNDAVFYGCDAGKTLLSISADGSVRACGSMSGAYLGSVADASILDTWHSSPFIDMRRQSGCRDCSYRTICWGQCRATPG
jgi:radical SAM protein with 4Fe4S-binding SPASM domain